MKSWKNAARMIIINKKLMNRLFLFLFATLIIIMTACNNSGEEQTTGAVVRTKADSLADEVDDGHNIGMAKMAPLTRAQQEAKRLLDSIAKLPGKAQQAASPYQQKLSGLLEELDAADSSMQKWMREYKWNAVFNSVEEKIKYLEPEKEKVTKVKNAILNSIQRADSLLKREF
jgi:hypothetical protein